MLIGFSKGFRLLWSVPMIHFDIRNLLKAFVTLDSSFFRAFVSSSCDGVRSIYLEARETTPPTFSATGNDWIARLLGQRSQLTSSLLSINAPRRSSRRNRRGIPWS